ncbi:hypothetical protein [Rhodovibrio sodomensis]|nr:hypothetical protein [Rhodovibrio sodomensis]
MAILAVGIVPPVLPSNVGRHAYLRLRVANTDPGTATVVAMK